MKRVLRCTLLVMLAASPLHAGAQPLGVYVAAVKSPLPDKPTEAEREQASAAYKAADTARKNLEKSLKAQYGKKRDKWPADAQEQMAAADEARHRLNVDWLYRTDAEPVEEHWRRAIFEALTQSGLTGRKEHITSVPSADQAQLIVTLVAVRNPSAVINAADDRCVAVRLGHGPKLSPERFASVPQTYRPRRFKAARMAPPGEGSPFWLFDVCGVHPYFSTEEAVANVVDDFAGAHRELLTGAIGQ